MFLVHLRAYTKLECTLTPRYIHVAVAKVLMDSKMNVGSVPHFSFLWRDLRLRLNSLGATGRKEVVRESLPLRAHS